MPPTHPSPSRWIQSGPFDGALFVLSPVVTLPIVALFYGGFPSIANRIFLVLTFAHYFSTGTFFLWDENKPYHRRRWIAFFVGPAAIALAVSLLLRFDVPLLLPVTIFFWNTFHVARQNCGILSIYRHRAGVAEPAQKTAANTAIVCTSLWLALWNISTHPEVNALLRVFSARLPLLLWAAAGLVATVALVRLAWALRKRAREGTLHLPEAAFVVTSLALFHPYLWVADSAGATAFMLLPHYVQYLGLVWLLQRRRFSISAASPGERGLRFLSARPVLLVATLGGSGLAVLLLQSAAFHSGHLKQFFACYAIIALLHFYLDGLFWAFKDPQVRRSIGPHLVSFTLEPLQQERPA